MQTLSQSLKQSAISEELASLLTVLANTSKDISQAVRRGALAGVLGVAGTENVQGEDQKKLDVITNDMLKDALAAQGSVKALASEEEDEIVPLAQDGQFLVCFDPLDGSSNIDINSLVGTIFSVLPAPSGDVSEQSFLQSGRKQVAAGYVLYGPSTMLALTTGQGVQLFTLDPVSGDYLLTVDGVQISPDTGEFAINMSNQRFWEPGMQAYIADLIKGKEGPRGKNFNMRWIAAMVGDVHRVLCRGGLFTYPTDTKDPKKPFKLRLMYEANPMAFLLNRQAARPAPATRPFWI